jgi:hypothetical protein
MGAPGDEANLFSENFLNPKFLVNYIHLSHDVAPIVHIRVCGGCPQPWMRYVSGYLPDKFNNQ